MMGEVGKIWKATANKAQGRVTVSNTVTGNTVWVWHQRGCWWPWWELSVKVGSQAELPSTEEWREFHSWCDSTNSSTHPPPQWNWDNCFLKPTRLKFPKGIQQMKKCLFRKNPPNMDELSVYNLWAKICSFPLFGHLFILVHKHDYLFYTFESKFSIPVILLCKLFSFAYWELFEAGL